MKRNFFLNVKKGKMEGVDSKEKDKENKKEL